VVSDKINYASFYLKKNEGTATNKKIKKRLHLPAAAFQFVK